MELRHAHHISISIHKSSLRHNLGLIQQIAPGKQVMGIVKKNAYGHGMVQVAQALERMQLDYLGVIYPEEGIQLRQAGIKTPILIMGATLPEDLQACIQHDLEIALLSSIHLQALATAAQAVGKQAMVHLKVDTGLGRLGVSYADAKDLIQAALSQKGIHLKGIFSHLASADLPDHAFTDLQVERFESVLAAYQELAGKKPFAHLAASGGTLYYPSTHFDMVRPGHILYGVLPDTAHEDRWGFQAVLSLQTKVLFSKKIKAGTPVGYGGKWRAARDTHIATLSLGYGDGYSRKLTSKGAQVIIDGQYMPIVGSVCMDQCMVNTGDRLIPPGTPTTVIGRQDGLEIHTHEVADLLDTVPDDILSGLNWHIPRNLI